MQTSSRESGTMITERGGSLRMHFETNITALWQVLFSKLFQVSPGHVQQALSSKSWTICRLPSWFSSSKHAHDHHISHVLGKCQVPDVQTSADKRPAAASNIGSIVILTVLSDEESGFLERTCLFSFVLLTNSSQTNQASRPFYADQYLNLQDFTSLCYQKKK